MGNPRKVKLINKRQLAVAEIWERDQSQTLDDMVAVLASEFKTKASRATVGRDLQALDQRNLAKSDAIITAVKGQLTDSYEMIYGEAMLAYNKSLEDKKTVTIENIEADGKKGKGRVKASEKTEGQSGNAAMLAQAQAALNNIEKLWGLDAPQKINASIGVTGKLVILPKQDG